MREAREEKIFVFIGEVDLLGPLRWVLIGKVEYHVFLAKWSIPRHYLAASLALRTKFLLAAEENEKNGTVVW